MEKQKFKDYLLKRRYKNNTVYAYSNAIGSISAHMTELRGDYIDLYKIYEIPRLKKVRDTYGLKGKYSDFGNNGRGTIRNAINRFVEFREWQQNNKSQNQHNSNFDRSFNEIENIEKESPKVSYEIESINYDQIFKKIKNIESDISHIRSVTNWTSILIISQVLINIILIYILFKS